MFVELSRVHANILYYILEICSDDRLIYRPSGIR